MRRLRRVGAIALATALAGAVLTPVASAVGEVGFINIHVDVVGYTAGEFGGFAGRLGCDGLAEPVDVGIEQGSYETGPIELMAGMACGLVEFSGGGAGSYAGWGGWSVEPADWVVVATGQTTTLTVSIERWYDGSQPEWDNGAWFPMEVFTVDRVYLNRYGGITAEGLAWCPALAASPAGPEPIIGIDWEATQYVGRKTAIHGAYGSDIGKWCFDAAHPDTPVRWTSMHPSGTEADTAWVYGIEGRFGSGMVRIDADSYNDLSVISQWWDPQGQDYSPTCSTTPDPDGWYDANGDGFCAYAIESGQRTTANLKTTVVKAR